MSQNCTTPYASAASALFNEYGDQSRCFYITPSQLGNHSPGRKQNANAREREEFLVTFSPRGSHSGEPQCSFQLELEHQDVIAMGSLFSDLMNYNDLVSSASQYPSQVELSATGEVYQFRLNAYARPSRVENRENHGSTMVLVNHFSVAVLINDNPHHLAIVNLNESMATVRNLAHDLAVLKALAVKAPEQDVRNLRFKAT